MFQYCSNLLKINLSSFKTNKVKDMSYMFEKCQNLTRLDLSHFYFSNDTLISLMFYGCHNLTILNLPFFKLNLISNNYNYQVFDECYNLPNKFQNYNN